MYLVYMDESGNTGRNLSDKNQPIVVLCALIVPESHYQGAEQALRQTVEETFPPPRPPGFEIHTVKLRNGMGYFRDFPLTDRLDFLSRWLEVAAGHEFALVYRAIEKRKFQSWMQTTFGAGVSVHPQVVAFPLVAQVVNSYLEDQGPEARGILISDENKEVVHDVEKSLQALRGIEGPLRLNRVIEKGFFIRSDQSILLQLCDVCAFAIRKKEEIALGIPARPTDEAMIERAERLVYRGDESFSGVIDWFREQQKKERPGT